MLLLGNIGRKRVLSIPSGIVEYIKKYPWWRHQMGTFSALLAICMGNSPVTGEFPTQRPVTRSFDVFFDLNKRLSKPSWGWWFEAPSRQLWRHCNAQGALHTSTIVRERLFAHLHHSCSHKTCILCLSSHLKDDTFLVSGLIQWKQISISYTCCNYRAISIN